MTAHRPHPAPPRDGITIQAIGDTHAGTTGMYPWRMDTVVRDSHRDRMIVPDAVVQVGDCTNDTPVTDTPFFTRFMSRFAAPHYAVMGNHDVYAQTPAEWASSLGYASPSYSVDLPGLRMVMWGVSDQWNNYEIASTANLSWLDSQLSTTTDPVFVFCHFPLYGTVGTINPVIDSDSKNIPYYVRTAGSPASSNGVLDVLTAHSNVKAWINGHTHSRLDAPDIVTPVTYGGHRFASVNASTPHVSATVFPWEMGNKVATAYVTLLDDRVEVRYRDHGAGQWAAPNGRSVFSVDLS